MTFPNRSSDEGTDHGPLTPALSRGEREEPAHGMGTGRVRPSFSARRTILPLPPGEGRGEGPQIRALQNSSAFSTSSNEPWVRSCSAFPNRSSDEGTDHGPLTPTFSRGEREEPAHGMGMGRVRQSFSARRTILPLPPGEGRGEGPQIKALQKSSSFWSSSSLSVSILHSPF